MKIQVLASSSSGNCYFVSDGETSILLECGITEKKIRKELDYNLGNIDGVLVTHAHRDHSRACKNMQKLGIPTYMTAETFESMDLQNLYSIETIEAHKQFEIGTFQILPFDTEHDCPGSVGFLLYSQNTKEKLLFATDTYFVKYKFNGLTHIMIECNYAKDIAESNLENELINSFMWERIAISHFSLENLKEFFRSNDLNFVKEIYLLHLSSRNADPERFKKEIQELTGKVVWIALEGGGVI